MGKHIIAENQVGSTAFGENHLGGCSAKVIDASLNAFLPGCLRGLRGGIDAQARYALGDEILQEIAVVGSHLDDEGLFPKAEPLHCHVRIPSSMIDRTAGVG